MTHHPDPNARSRLRLIVQRTAELPPLKSVAAKAIAIAEDEHSAAMDLAAVLSSDQALTARLLRLSNSAYYGYPRRIGTVREAVVLLGMRTVRSVAITSGIIDSFRSLELDGFNQDLFWAHNVTVGIVTEAFARDTKVARPEDAFTAGVLHDVGKLAMLLCEPAAFADVVDLVASRQMRFFEAERAVFGFTHSQVGGRLAERWRFPQPLVAAIREHHDRLTGSFASLSDLVNAANLAVNRMGMAAGWDWTDRDEYWPREALPPRAEEALRRIPGGVLALEEKARAFLTHVSTRPPQWYAHREFTGFEGSARVA